MNHDRREYGPSPGTSMPDDADVLRILLAPVLRQQDDDVDREVSDDDVEECLRRVKREVGGREPIGPGQPSGGSQIYSSSSSDLPHGPRVGASRRAGGSAKAIFRKCEIDH